MTTKSLIIAGLLGVAVIGSYYISKNMVSSSRVSGVSLPSSVIEKQRALLAKGSARRSGKSWSIS